MYLKGIDITCADIFNKEGLLYKYRASYTRCWLNNNSLFLQQNMYTNAKGERIDIVISADMGDALNLVYLVPKTYPLVQYPNLIKEIYYTGI